MRLKELIIEEFGKFKNKKIYLDYPITLFYGPNESGKTTILEALEYALIPRATLSRNYPVKESTLIVQDQGEIFELNKGKCISKKESNMIKFFNTMKPKFFRNIFHIRTGELEISEKIESGMDFAYHLKEKILELENFFFLKDSLEDYLGYLVSPSKRKSKIEKEIEELIEDKNNLEMKRENWKQIRELNIEKEEKSREKEKLESELENKQKKLEEMENFRKMKELENELINRYGLKRVYEDLQELNSISKEDYETLKGIDEEINKINNQIKILEEKEKLLKEEIQEREENRKRKVEEIKSFNRMADKSSLRKDLIWILLLTVLILLNILIKILMNLPLLTLLPAVALFFGVIFLISGIGVKGRLAKRGEMKLKEEEIEIRKMLKDKEENLEKLVVNKENLEKERENLKIEIEEIFKKSGVNSIGEYESKWDRKRNLLNEKKFFIKKLNEKAISRDENLKEIDLLSKEIDQLKKKKVEKYVNDEYEALRSRVPPLNEKLKILSNQIGEIEGRIKILKRDLTEEEPQIIKKIDLINFKIQEKEKTKELLVEFYKILREIENETESFLKKTIEKDGSFWFSKLTLNKYKGIEISEWKDFYIILNNNEKKEITWLSKGAQDQLYFSLRLALAQRVIGEETEFFLILDDPFITFDPERIKEAVSIIKEISNNHQIIFATKDKYTMELIKKTGGNIIDVESL